jgi:hypothetical protein
MLAAIDFDHQTPLEADKIQNEVLKGHLPAEFEVRKPVIAEQSPNSRLSIRRLATHLFSEGSDTLAGRSMMWVFAARTPHPALRATFSHKGRREEDR